MLGIVIFLPKWMSKSNGNNRKMNLELPKCPLVLPISSNYLENKNLGVYFGCGETGGVGISIYIGRIGG